MMAPKCELTVQGSDENTTRTTITLERAKVIGRDTTCDVQLESRSISGQHAGLRWSEGQLEVRDLGSSFGTFIGETRISGWTQVREQDSVWVGDTSIRFDLTWPPIPTPVQFNSAEHRLAFTLVEEADRLGQREMPELSGLHSLLPLRFARERGRITSVSDVNGVEHVFVDGRLELGGVELALAEHDDSMASMVAPLPAPPPTGESLSAPPAADAAESSAPLPSATPELTTSSEPRTESTSTTGSSDSALDSSSSNAASPAAGERTSTVPDSTPHGRTGVDWLMLLMGIAALIALGAFAAWIL